MTNPKLPNPFNSHEDWEEWFNKDRFYRQSLAKSWKMYIKQNPLPNTFFMKLHTNYLNFVNFLTKNAIVATAICLIALTAVSASAAQLVAPTEYKPSTLAGNLFGANKQKETNPYTALKPDGENDVASMDKCDLSVKYPKTVNSKNLVAVSKKEDNEITNMKKIQDYVYIMDETKARDGGLPYDLGNFEQRLNVAKNSLTFPSIVCQDKNIESNFVSEIFSPEVYNPNVILVENVQEYIGADAKKKVLELTGWFIGESKLENLHLYESKNQLTKNIAQNEAKEYVYYYTTDNYKLVFEFKEKYYTIIFDLPSQTQRKLPEKENNFSEKFNINFETTNIPITNLAGTFGNSLQLQFNSLVKNEANKEILAKSESVASVANSINSSQKSQDNSQVITKTLTFAGEGYGHVILHENQMTPGEGNKFIASYYTKTRSEFTNTKSTGGAVPEFRVVGKIKENPKTFELFDKITVKFELFDVEKVEQINIAQNSVNSPFSLSGKGCVGSDNNTKCEIMENGKAVTTIRTCGLDGLCLTSIEQGVKTDDYQYFYSPGYEGSGLTIYPFNIKTKKMEKSFEIMDPCARMDINSLEYKTCFEGEKIKQYNQDYLKYVGQKPQEYLPQNEEREFVNSVFTLVKKDGNTLYWTSDLVCQPDSNDCTLYSTTQDFRTPEDIRPLS